MERNNSFWQRCEPWQHEFLLERMKKKTNYSIGGYIFGGFTLFFLLGVISSINDGGKVKQIALFGILAFAMALFTFAFFYLTRKLHKKLDSKDYFVQEVQITQINNGSNNTQPVVSLTSENGKTTTIIINYRFSQVLFVGARGMMVAIPDVNTNVIGPNSYYFFPEGQYAFAKENNRRFSASSELSRKDLSEQEHSETNPFENAQSKKSSQAFTTPSLSEHEAILPVLSKKTRPWIFLFLIPLLLGNGLGVYHILFGKPGKLLFLKTISVCLADLSAILPYYVYRRTQPSDSRACPPLLILVTTFGELFVGTTPLMKKNELPFSTTLILISSYILVTVLYVVTLIFMTQKNRRLSRALKTRDYEILPGYVFDLSSALIGSGRSSYTQYYLHVKCRDRKVYRLISSRARNNQLMIGQEGTLVRVKIDNNPEKEPDYYFAA